MQNEWQCSNWSGLNPHASNTGQLAHYGTKLGGEHVPCFPGSVPFSMHKTWIMAAAQGRMNVCLVQAGLQHVCFLFCSCLVIVLLLHLQRGQALALAAAAECEAALALLHERAVLAGAERVLVEVLELGVRAREACAPRRYSSTDRSGLEQASQLAHAHHMPNKLPPLQTKSVKCGMQLHVRVSLSGLVGRHARISRPPVQRMAAVVQGQAGQQHSIESLSCPRPLAYMRPSCRKATRPAQVMR